LNPLDLLKLTRPMIASALGFRVDHDAPTFRPPTFRATLRHNRSWRAPLAPRLRELAAARALAAEGSPKELHDATGLVGRPARCRARTIARRLEKRIRRDIGRGTIAAGGRR
jgi:hypothetical protein